MHNEINIKMGKERYGNAKTIEISILEEDYSNGIDSKLRSAGFKNVGSGGGSYEYQIEAKSTQDVVSLLRKAGVDPGLFSI